MRWIPDLFPWRMALLAGLLFAPLRCMNPAWSQTPASPPGPALADCAAPADPAEGPATEGDVAQAVAGGLRVLARGAREYPEHRQCFACHHQTLPLLALTAAHRLDLPRETELEQELATFVRESFLKRTDELRAGEGVGGKALTVGYALWTLRLAGEPADDLTDAMVAYLLKTQSAEGAWELHSIRPPAEESVMFETVLAAAGIRHSARASQQAAGEAAVERTRGWLTRQTPRLHEDRVARVWGVALLGGPSEEAAGARQSLLQTQNSDGSWSQTAELSGDPYATATALYALIEAGLPAGDDAIQRGVAFLRKSQQPDGSWQVATRATPVQVFFDNGDPGGKSQFISMMATGWATAVLARTATIPPR
jgi:N-acyl-D-amino-acid deacylase